MHTKKTVKLWNCVSSLVGGKSSLGNIYVGQIENIAANIGAAFVQISAGERCYLQLSDASNAIYTSVRKGDRPLKPGDEILVQISRDAMKGKTSGSNYQSEFYRKISRTYNRG